VLDDEKRRETEQTTIDPSLKYDTSGKVPIILVPQPSDDPNDPLVRLLLSAELNHINDN